MDKYQGLPIGSILPELLGSIEKQDCILSAPPGAGKSTLLPLSLLDLPAYKNKLILLLQPRQVAVRSIAFYLAEQLGQEVGQCIGYQMRGESAISHQTRLCVITEGVLIAKLQSDPELDDIGLIIFDEFHERSLYSDIALGLCLEVQNALREDLRLLVMSATLHTESLQGLLPNAKSLSCEGRVYPIDYIYCPMGQRENAVKTICNIIEDAVKKHEGNILVFLPGVGLINKLQHMLSNKHLSERFGRVQILPLHGSLNAKQQGLAIQAPSKGDRKVVLATNIAETSLTIDGLRIVIDSGREKTLKLNIPRKSDELYEQLISKSSSVQRAGRAGRQQPGICYRLWSKEQQQYLVQYPPAPITQQDISQYLLLLLEWGTNFEQLPLIDQPSHAQISYAFRLLSQLGLVDDTHKLTSKGKLAAKFNTHVRLASILAEASLHLETIEQNKSSLHYAVTSSALLAILESRQFERSYHQQKRYAAIDLLAQVKTFCKQAESFPSVLTDCLRWLRRLMPNISKKQLVEALKELSGLQEMLVKLLVSAYPDKVASKKRKGIYLLTDGTGAAFSHHDENTDNMPSWLVCIETQVSLHEYAIIRKYISFPEAVLEEYIKQNTVHVDSQTWDHDLQKVVQKQQQYLGKIQLHSHSVPLRVSDQTYNILYQQLASFGLFAFINKHSPKAMQLVYRVLLSYKIDKGCQLAMSAKQNVWSEAQIINQLPDILAPYIEGLSTWAQLQTLNWYDILCARFNWDELQYLNEYFPTHYIAPTQNKHPLVYSEQGSVQLSIRIQELYGLRDTPTVGINKYPITLSLLSPAQREVQKTSDLAGFWQGSYQEVQKDMKGRYPKHYWPDKPHQAIPTTRTKKRM